jgi:hypothetical protein
MSDKPLFEMSREEIIEKISKERNGEYAYDICLNCGSFKSGPDREIQNAKFYDVCGRCVNRTEIKK